MLPALDNYLHAKEPSWRISTTNIGTEHEIEDNKTAVEITWKSFSNDESIKAMKESKIESKSLLNGVPFSLIEYTR